MKKIILFFAVTISLNAFGITWATIEDISGINSDNVRISSDGSGKAFAVWMHNDGTSEVIQNSINTGTWSTPLTLSPSGYNSNLPQVSASNGRAVAIWQLDNGTNLVIQAAVYTNGFWGTPVQLSTQGFDAFDPKVAINSSGVAFAVWTESTTGVDVIKSSQYASGSWGAAQTRSNSSVESFSPSIAIASTAVTTTALAVWMTSGTTFTIQGASFLLGVWSSPTTLSATEVKSSNPQVVMNATGMGVAVWESTGSSIMDQVNVAHFTGAVWAPQITLSDPLLNANSPSISMNANGNAAAVWQYSNSEFGVGAATYMLGTWSSPEVIAIEPLISRVRVGVDGNNNAIAVWGSDNTDETLVRYSEFQGAWSSPTTLSYPNNFANNPVISAEPSGNVYVAWENFDGSIYQIQAIFGIP